MSWKGGGVNLSPPPFSRASSSYTISDPSLAGNLDPEGRDMTQEISKAERDFFVVLLKEEAREAIWKVGASVEPQVLVDSVIEELQGLAPRTDGSETRSEEEICSQVRERLLKAAYETRPYCIKCGTCCMEGSPTLTTEDWDLLRADVLKPENLMTVRKGEPTYDSRTQQTGPAAQEMLKIREQPGSRTCLFYDGWSKRCSIYEDRPLQCRRQECWNPEPSRSANDTPLTRHDLFRSVGELLDVIERHEERCSYEELSMVMARLSATKGQTVEDIVEMLRYDQHVRDFLKGKLGLDPEAMELFLGRPLRTAIESYGLRVEDQPDGSFLVTAIEGNSEK